MSKSVIGASLSLKAISKRFGSVTAVSDVDLAVEPGEFVSLLGPSGSGKTTSLNMIAGFEEPNDGRIFINDRDITDIPIHRRNIGMVFQVYALFPHMTVEKKDRKSTRLNSSHVSISYAVFCLKKQNIESEMLWGVKVRCPMQRR